MLLLGWTCLKFVQTLLNGGDALSVDFLLALQCYQIRGMLALRVCDGCEKVHLFLPALCESGLNLSHPGVDLSHLSDQGLNR